MKDLGRVITAMVTPFDEAGRVDYEQAKQLALALLDSGSQGLLVAGTTGESPTLTKDEKLRLFSEIKNAVGDRGTVIAGTGNYSTAESIDLTRKAEYIGVDAALLVVPYYNKPTQEGLYQHFKAISSNTSLPCILYNVPGRTGANLAAETVIRLSEINNIAGIKEASGNFDQIGRIIAGARDNFLVYSGNDGDTLPILALGGYGIVSVASHLVGLQLKQMIDHYLWNDTAEASALHRRLMPLFNALFVLSNPIPLKYALNRVGFVVGKPRLPLTEPDPKSAAQIDAVLTDCQIDLPISLSKVK